MYILLQWQNLMHVHFKNNTLLLDTFTFDSNMLCEKMLDKGTVYIKVIKWKKLGKNFISFLLWRLTTIHFLHLLLFHGFPFLTEPHHKDTEREPQGDTDNADQKSYKPGLLHQVLFLWPCK